MLLRPKSADARLNLGNALKDLGRLDEAIAAYRAGLTHSPEHVELTSNLGVALHQAGDPRAALALFDAAIVRRPTLKEARIGRARLLHGLGRHEDSIAEWNRLLELAPDHADALAGLSLAERSIGHTNEAISYLERAIALKPGRADLLGNLGNLLNDANRHADAIARYERALAITPDSAEILCNLAIALHQSGQLDAADETLKRVFALKPNLALLHTNLGVLRSAQGRPDEAIAAYRQAIKLDPRDAKALQNICAALLQMGDVEGALEFGWRAVALGGHNHASYQHQAAAQAEAGDAAGAADSSRKAAALAPDNAELQNNLCGALVMTGDVAGAVEAGRKAVALDPTFEASQFNLACAELLSGDLAAGFEHYEARPRDPNLAHWRDSAPLWTPNAPRGSRALVYVEQGMGDAIQFARYVPRLIARGDKVVLGLYKPLRRLLSGLPGTTTVTPEEPLPPVDFQIRMLSLPHAFGTTLESVPAQVPYLRLPADAIAPWRTRLGPEPLHVGLVWRGNPNHKNDRNRSVDPALLAPLMATGNVQWVSLQKGAKPDDLSALRRTAPIADWTEELSDFADTAALISALDLVITVDTSVAHLAGALAKPVWLLLPFAPDWRWLMARENSPWYPSARLFRQAKAGDWPSVLARVAATLREEAARHGFGSALRDVASLRTEADQLAAEEKRTEAIALYRQALALAPADADLLGNLAALLIDEGELDKGITLCRAAIARAPTRPRNHVNLALALLAKGKFGEGFDEYEWRYRDPTAPHPPGVAPAWTPDVPKGSTVIVEAEQGIGDEILYASMLGDLQRTGARVIAEADARLIPLLRRSLPGIETMARRPSGQRTVKSARVFYTIPAASLGRFFRRDESNIPRVPHLRADPVRVAALQEQLGDGRLLCGLAWWSRRAETGARRTPALELWSPLLSIEGVRFVSLQYDPDAAGLDTLRRQAPAGIEEVPGIDMRADLDGAAALINALDLVITIGNSTADIAGALGQDTWVLLPKNPDWRWQVEREDSAWYSKARLFRQSEPNRWDDVIARVAAALSQRLAAKGEH